MAKAKVTEAKTSVALRGFLVTGDAMANIEGGRNSCGALLIKQGTDIILVPSYAIAAFKRAVADVRDCP